jgi:Transposase IS200 like
MLVGDVDVRLKAVIAEVAAEVGAELIEVEMMPDNAHLLAEVPPPVPPSAVSVLQDSGAGRRRAVFNQRVPDAVCLGYGATRRSRSAASPQSAADVPTGNRTGEAA